MNKHLFSFEFLKTLNKYYTLQSSSNYTQYCNDETKDSILPILNLEIKRDPNKNKIIIIFVSLSLNLSTVSLNNCFSSLHFSVVSTFGPKLILLLQLKQKLAKKQDSDEKCWKFVFLCVLRDRGRGETQHITLVFKSLRIPSEL